MSHSVQTINATESTGSFIRSSIVTCQATPYDLVAGVHRYNDISNATVLGPQTNCPNLTDSATNSIVIL